MIKKIPYNIAIEQCANRLIAASFVLRDANVHELLVWCNLNSIDFIYDVEFTNAVFESA